MSADDLSKVGRYRRYVGGLIWGLLVVFVLLGVDMAVSVADYRVLSYQLRMARLPAHANRPSDQQAASGIEDDMTMLRIRIGSHGLMVIIILWCLNAALRARAFAASNQTGVPITADHQP